MTDSMRSSSSTGWPGCTAMTSLPRSAGASTVRDSFAMEPGRRPTSLVSNTRGWRGSSRSMAPLRAVGPVARLRHRLSPPPHTDEDRRMRLPEGGPRTQMRVQCGAEVLGGRVVGQGHVVVFGGAAEPDQVGLPARRQALPAVADLRRELAQHPLELAELAVDVVVGV